MDPKSINNQQKIGICGRSALQVFFSGLNLHLKLVFAATSEPANLDFDATLTGFVRFLRFQEDRIKNDFTTIFDALEAPKITPKSTKNRQKSIKNQHRKNNIFFNVFFVEFYLQKGPPNSQKIDTSG